MSRVGAVLVVVVVTAACATDLAPTATPRSSATREAAPSAQPSAPSAQPSAPSAPFTVRESEEADALFSRPDTCTNPEIGYTVTFPDDWYTNTAIGDQAACSWFAPDFFVVDGPGELPDEIWIVISSFEGLVGYNTLTQVELGEEVEIDGYLGHRAEFRMLDSIDDTDAGDPTYHYVVPFDVAGPTLIAATGLARADDYELAKAVLDRIMASMDLAP